MRISSGYSSNLDFDFDFDWSASISIGIAYQKRSNKFKHVANKSINRSNANLFCKIRRKIKKNKLN